MSKVYKAVSSVGSAALLLAGSAMAAPPTNMNFGDWQATQASPNKPMVIKNVVCDTATYTCGSAITGDGFFQRQITKKDGSGSYFQTIITDAGMGRTIAGADQGAPGNLTFFDESFVATGNQDGIADKQSIKQLETVTGASTSERYFKNTTELSVGWAAAGGSGADLKLYQGIYDTKNEGFRTDFWWAQKGSAANQAMAISSRVGLGGTFGSLGQAGSEYQDFYFVEKKGSFFNSTSGTVAILGSSSGNNTMAWSANQDIKATWVGQEMQATLGQTFMFEGYDNVTTSTVYDLVSTFSLARTGITPQYWANGTWGTIDTWDEATPKNTPTNPGFFTSF